MTRSIPRIASLLACAAVPLAACDDSTSDADPVPADARAGADASPVVDAEVSPDGDAAPPSPEFDRTALVAYFPLNGDGVDASGQGHHGTLLGTQPAADRDGNEGGALAFDGVGDGLVIADSPDFDLADGDLTVALWVRPLAGGGAAGLIGQPSTRVNSGWRVDLGPGPERRLTLGLGAASASLEVPAIADGAWAHVAIIKSGEQVDIYVDGVRHDAGELVGSSRLALDEVRVGFVGVGPQDQHFLGELDELVVFARALEPAEVEALVAGDSAGLAGPDAERPAPDLAFDPSWSRCALYPGNPASPRAECAVAPMPLDHADPWAGRHPYAVKRLVAEESRAQLWLLAGGPGFSGQSLAGLAEVIHALNPDVDVYLPDHRGTGGSNALVCGPEESEDSEGGGALVSAEYASCLAGMVKRDGRRLPHLTMSAHARDLGRMIEATRAPDQQVFVYGLSYGGRLALRYLELFPDQADGVVLDSPGLPGHPLTEQPGWVDEAGVKLMSMCAEDPGCAEKLGDDPHAVARGLGARLDDGHCPELGIDGLALGRVLGGMLLAGTQPRSLIPAVVYRLDRCAPGDVTALQNLLEFVNAPAQPTPFFTLLLGAHVLYSDLWPSNPLTAEAYVEAERRMTMTTGDNSERVELHTNWPRYVPDHDDGWPEFGLPVLVLQSEIDPAAAPSLLPEIEARLGRDDQHVVLFPHADHAVVFNSPTASTPSCGIDLIGAFMADPSGALDTGCAAEHLRYDFEFAPQLTRDLFGTDDRWENAEE